MDFGIGFLSNNIMLPILDFFYGIVPSYGLAIVALTLVIRFALYPLSAGSIRNMRRMKVAQPAMQKRVKEIQARYKDDPAKQQQEMGQVYKEFGNPLAGCFPVLLQMPILFALFATLRGSPFADINYSVNFQILPGEKIEQTLPQAFSTKPQNVYLEDGVHASISAVVPGGNRLAVGEKTRIDFQTVEGQSLETLLSAYPEAKFVPTWLVMKGEELVNISETGTLEALAPGDVTLQATIPGLAAQKGFLFIKALGRVGAFGDEGEIHWDILGMVMFFGVSLYINQLLSGQQAASDNPQQAAINKYMPVMFSGMFLFFPLPAGVLMYMVIANVFQTGQTFLLSREPLPEHLQKIVDAEAKAESGKDREQLPFERRTGSKETAKEASKVTKQTSTKGTKSAATPKGYAVGNTQSVEAEDNSFFKFPFPKLGSNKESLQSVKSSPSAKSQTIDVSATATRIESEEVGQTSVKPSSDAQIADDAKNQPSALSLQESTQANSEPSASTASVQTDENSIQTESTTNVKAITSNQITPDSSNASKRSRKAARRAKKAARRAKKQV
ncbi:MAG: membrane protein insertase YidC [Cyanothece sp. SIO1E1]|nr:membrane protein insertase YidC [Cyanothece sp. SIO1E1]